MCQAKTLRSFVNGILHDRFACALNKKLLETTLSIRHELSYFVRDFWISDSLSALRWRRDELIVLFWIS